MMRIGSGRVVVLFVLCQVPAGCGRATSEKSVGGENAKPQIGSEQQSSAIQAAQLFAPQASQGRIPDAGTKGSLPKDVIVLKGSPLGAVKFEHKLHSQARSIKCETCHHASKAEKPATVLQKACSDCHTSVAIPPMKTKLQAAFHNPTATAGTCIDCHKSENAKGKVAPVKCQGCHKKEKV